MLVVVFNNQQIVAANGSTVTIESDPIAFGGDNSFMATIKNNGFAPTATAGKVTFTFQMSNNGTDWVDTTIGAVEIDETTTTGGMQTRDSGVLGAVFFRVEAELVVTGGTAGAMAAVNFDLHVNTYQV